MTIGSVAAQRVPETDQELLIRVRVYNQAQVPENELTEATQQASRLLALIGVQPWIDCTNPEGSNPECHQGYRAYDLALRIVPTSARLPVPINAFGLALLDTGKSGIYAYVFYYPVLELAAAENGASRSLVLGHVFAHELGHLLIGSGSHTSSGLMTANWRAPQLRRASQGRMRFDRRQGALIVAELRSRRQLLMERIPSDEVQER
jgi:hypothetical protein